LLEHNDDVNEVSEFGESALHAAVENNHKNIVQQLIGASADVHARHNLSAQQTKFPPKLPKGFENSDIGKDYPDSIFTPMNEVNDVEIARMLYRAGAPIKELDNEVRIQLTGAARQPER
jgi:hypothetical protein